MNLGVGVSVYIVGDFITWRDDGELHGKGMESEIETGILYGVSVGRMWGPT